MGRMGKMFLGSLLCGLFLTGAAVTASAAQAIGTVNLDIVPYDQLYNMSPGDVVEGSEDEVSISGGGSCWISSCTISGNTQTVRHSYTYTIDIQAGSGYYFTNNTVVSVCGAYNVEMYLRSNQRMRVRASAYPYCVLDYVKNIVTDTNAKMVTWDPVPGAKNYSVYVYYTSSNGTVRSAKKSTSKTELNLSSYIDKYDDVYVSVRASRGGGVSDRYLAESEYVFDSGAIDDEHYSGQYDFNNIPTSTNWQAAGGISSEPTGVQSPGMTGPGVSGPAGPGTGSAPVGTGGPGALQGPAGYFGWQGSGETWYYMVNGVRATGWLSITPEEWYFLYDNGLMAAGWFNDKGVVYLLNPSHDGTYGKMMTGRQYFNGNWYYFNETHDGTYGAMYVNRYVPGGGYAGPDGIIR